MAEFVLLFDEQHLKTYEIEEPVVTIGRLPENTISIVNMGVSRRHARIEKEPDGRFFITDLSSLNGTFVNNKKTSKGHLTNGDKISIGKYTIIFKNDEPEKVVENEGNGFSEEEPELVLESPAPTSEEPEFVLEPTIPTSEEPAVTELEPDSGPTAPVSEPPVEKAPPIETDKGSNETQPGCPVLIETNKHVVYRLDKDFFTLGNSENDDIFVDGLFIEENIVEIEKREDGIWLLNKKLLGKTKVNGKKIKNHLLQHKDRIEIGSSTFRFMENE